MTDKEFIDRLNDIIFNYGYVIIDMNDRDYYFKKFHIYYNTSHNINYNTSHIKTVVDIYRYRLFSVLDNDFILKFKSLEMMMASVGSFKSIFDLMREEDKWRISGYSFYFTDKFIDFILSIEGTSKEEILLKLQLLGY